MKHIGKQITQTILILIFIVGLTSLGFCREYRNNLHSQDNFYQKLSDGFDVNILVVGDSISQGAGASDDEHRWTLMFKSYIEETYGVKVLLNNVSLGGNTSYAGYVRTRELQDGDIYDLVIVCFAENDKEEDFDLYYEACLRAIKRMCPQSSIVTVLESSQREYTNKIQFVQSLSESYGAEVVDTIAAFDNSGIPYEELSEDGIHPSDEGHRIYYESFVSLVEDEIIQDTNRNVISPVSYIGQRMNFFVSDMKLNQEFNLQENQLGNQLGNLSDISFVREDVTKFDSCKYYGLSDFYETEDLHYVLDFKEVTNGILGIDYTYFDGEYDIQLLIDGVESQIIHVGWNGGFPQRHIWIVDEACEINHRLELVFDCEEQVENFEGIILSGTE